MNLRTVRRYREHTLIRVATDLKFRSGWNLYSCSEFNCTWKGWLHQPTVDSLNRQVGRMTHEDINEMVLGIKPVRHRPNTVKAVKVTTENIGEVAIWCGGHVFAPPPSSENTLVNPYIVVPTLKGKSDAFIGDWIIRGTEREFYPILDSVYHSVYEDLVQLG